MKTNVKMCIIFIKITTGNISSRAELHVQDESFDAADSQFTLSYTTTGGPATTVTWTRDSETVSDGSSTVLEDPVAAEYTHTLTVTGRHGGHYQCTVSNNKPSTASSELIIQGNLNQIFYE